MIQWHIVCALNLVCLTNGERVGTCDFITVSKTAQKTITVIAICVMGLTGLIPAKMDNSVGGVRLLRALITYRKEGRTHDTDYKTS